MQVLCEEYRKGYSSIKYKTADKLLDIFIESGVDLRCHSSRFPQKSPLFIALHELKISKEEEIFLPKNSLIRKLIINGATLKKRWDDKRTFGIPWFDVEQVKSYLISVELKKKELEIKKLEIKK